MNEPTEEQIKKFWEWCGFNLTCYSHYLAWFINNKCLYSEVREYDNPIDKLPPIDLNNLFKWAVPTLKDTCEEWWSVIVEWAKDITGNYEKDTLALFWAINKVIKED